MKVVVSMDSLQSGEGRAVRSWAAERGVVVVDFEEVEKLGRRERKGEKPPRPDSVLTVMYTSGTTG